MTALHLVCPHCAAINRVPEERLSETPRCGQCKQALFNGEPLTLSANNFDRHFSRSDLPLVIDFWAPWCGPCQQMAPTFSRAAGLLEPRARLAKIDTEAEPELAARFGIRSIPTLILFKNGQETARQSGALPLPALLDWIQTRL